MKLKNILLGYTKDQTIITGEMELRGRQFSACFEEHRAFDFNAETEEEQIECLDDTLRECYDKEWLWDQCDIYDCKPSDLAQEIYNRMDIDEVLYIMHDTSLFPLEIEHGDMDIRFDGLCCGQHDPRPDIDIILEPKLFDRIMWYWDNYHLKEVSDEQAADIMDMEKEFEYYASEENQKYLIINSIDKCEVNVF